MKTSVWQVTLDTSQPGQPWSSTAVLHIVASTATEAAACASSAFEGQDDTVREVGHVMDVELPETTVTDKPCESINLYQFATPWGDVWRTEGDKYNGQMPKQYAIVLVPTEHVGQFTPPQEA